MQQQEHKLKTISHYFDAVERGDYWHEWTTYMGIRADERHRHHSLLRWKSTREEIVSPMIEWGVTKQDVIQFWRQQDFDLALDPDSDLGNCDCCFLKATGKLIKIIEAEPARADWWIETADRFQGNYSKSKPTFAQIKAWALNPEDPARAKYLKNHADKSYDCFCGSD